MEKVKLVEQVERFKEEFGEIPELPIKISYKWCLFNAEGEITPGYYIHGYPGLIPIDSEEITDVVMISDARQRPFPVMSTKGGDC